MEELYLRETHPDNQERYYLTSSDAYRNLPAKPWPGVTRATSLRLEHGFDFKQETLQYFIQLNLNEGLPVLGKVVLEGLSLHYSHHTCMIDLDSIIEEEEEVEDLKRHLECRGLIKTLNTN